MTTNIATQIKAAMATFHQPGDVFEIRIPKSRQKTVSGYFNDNETAAAAVTEWDGRCEGVYMTVNPINPALLARAANRLVPFANNTTADHDVLSRRWFLIDFDPCRPSGISATKEQHRAALERAKAFRDLLRERGWPEPVVGDSGNGAHLSYRVDLPNEPWVRDLFKNTLAALDLLLSDDAVAVDLTPHNAARIWKLYGTLACKGDSTPEHPYRRSRLLKVPEALMPIPVELLRALANEGKEPRATQPRRMLVARETRGDFDLDNWISRNSLAVEPCVSWQGGRKWIFRVCPWNAEHTNRSAFLVQFMSGAIAAGCHHNGCAGYGWADLRALYEPSWPEPLWPMGNDEPPASMADALRDLQEAQERLQRATQRVLDLT